MMTPVVSFVAWIFVVPLSIVDRNLHLLWIAIVETVAAAIVFATPEVLRVVNVWVVIEAAVVSIAGRSSPVLPIGWALLLSTCLA